MTFATDIKDDFDALLALGELSEDVTYTPDGGAPIAIKAFVTDGSLEDSNVIGFSAEKRLGAAQPPIVQVSKTDVAVVTLHKDTVAVGGVTYTVKAILDEDAGAWRLYCVK